MKTIYLIHHSHTDIGYTEMQQRIQRWHVDFIKQAIHIIKKQPGFVWNCEQFWAVEKFWEVATLQEKEDFTAFVKSENIGLSGNYLNFNELIDSNTLKAVTKRAVDFGIKIGYSIKSGMTADVNGFGWGYAQTLLDCGIKNFFTCVHTHHGMFPLFKKQIPFWWETAKGEKLLVWNGEHYHFGNELGFAPLAGSSYQIKDECDHDTIYYDFWKMAETRIPRYIQQLEKEDYPYDFFPMMVSGLRTDNAPPSPAIMEMITRWNREHRDLVEIKMVTLDQFFAVLRDQDVDIPTYKGDWPDWWSDGMAGNPDYTSIYRRAQRNYSYLNSLLERYPELEKPGFKDLEYNLALYAEHTFSHASAMHNPWLEMVKGISSRKKVFAVMALEETENLRDELHAELGETCLKYNMPLRYKILNPTETAITNYTKLQAGHFEFVEKRLDKGLAVKCGDNKLPHQLVQTSTGAEIWVWLEMTAGEEKVLEVSPSDKSSYFGKMIDNTSLMGSDRVYDILQESEKCRVEETFMQTSFVKISWDKTGINSWEDLKSGKQMLRKDRDHNAFSPVYDVSSRRNIGRNRKAFDYQRSVGTCHGLKEQFEGDLFIQAKLGFSCNGFEMYDLNIRAWKNLPRVDVSVVMHKTSKWEAENVYLSLPFFNPENQKLLLDKVGAVVEPWVDQLLGTLTDFYSVQAGVLVESENENLAISTIDSNIIQLGSLDYKPRILMGMPELDNEPAQLYAWLMTNYWETNFEANLGGFYEFNFSLGWGEDVGLECCREMAEPFSALRLKD